MKTRVCLDHFVHDCKPTLEEYECDAAILYIGISDLLIFDKNSNTLVSIRDGNINAGLRCRMVMLEKYLFQAWYSNIFVKET